MGSWSNRQRGALLRHQPLAFELSREVLHRSAGELRYRSRDPCIAAAGPNEPTVGQ